MIMFFLKSFFRLIVLGLPPKQGQILYFFRRNHYWPSLGSPKTFNEKVVLRKLKPFPHSFVSYSDKLQAKMIVRNLVGEGFVTPTLWCGPCLPNEETLLGFVPFVLKANFGNNKVFFCSKKEDLNYKTLKTLAYNWIHGPAQDPICHEKWYDSIKRCLLIEPHLTNGGQPPDDFKVFCFNGKPLYIQVDSNRFTNHKRDFYDHEWNYMHNFSFLYPNSGIILKRPVFLSELLRIASILSKEFDFVRVDFFCLPRIRFGEFTFAPESGWGRFNKKVFDLQWGGLWNQY